MEFDYVKVFKLITGEEIIAEYVPANSSSKHGWELKNPVMLVMQPNRDGNGIGVGILPYANHINGNILIHSDKILYQGEPTEDLLNTYKSIFSKIQVVNPSLVVPK